MIVSEELLKIMQCPNCKSKVKLKDDETGITCQNSECRLTYPIKDKIPVMLVDEATIEN